MNEPVADSVRSILDGHVVRRGISRTESLPRIDILASVSRLMPDITAEGHRVHGRPDPGICSRRIDPPRI